MQAKKTWQVLIIQWQEGAYPSASRASKIFCMRAARRILRAQNNLNKNSLQISRVVGGRPALRLVPKAAPLSNYLEIESFIVGCVNCPRNLRNKVFIGASALWSRVLHHEMLRLSRRRLQSHLPEIGILIEGLYLRQELIFVVYLEKNDSSLHFCTLDCSEEEGGCKSDNGENLEETVSTGELQRSMQELQDAYRVLQLDYAKLLSANNKLLAENRELKKDSDELEGIFEGMGLPLVLMSMDLSATRLNRAAENIFGKEAAFLDMSVINPPIFDWVKDCAADGCGNFRTFNVGERVFEVSCVLISSDSNMVAGRSIRQNFDLAKKYILVLFWDRTFQRTTEQRSLEDLQKLQAALDLAPDPIAIRKIDGTYSYANQLYKNNFGLGQDFLNAAEAVLLPSDLSQALNEINEEALTSRQAVRREVYWHQGDNHFCSLCIVFALFDAEDRAYATVRIFTDVTPLRNARESLRKQAEKLQQIIDGVSDSLVLLDSDGKIEQFNEAWRLFVQESQNLGCGESMVGGSIISCYFDKLLLDRCNLAEMLVKRQPFEFEHLYESPTGSRRYLLRGTPLKMGGTVLLHIDITARYLEELNRRMTQVVFENANDIILICKPGGEVMMANPQAAFVFGNSNLVGVRLWSLFTKEFLVRQGRKVRHLLRQGKSWRGEAQAALGDGRVAPLWGSATVVRSDPNNESYWIIVASNIAPLKAAQALLSHQAFYDDLTGLPNRRLFQESLTNAIQRSKSSNLSLSLIFIDLDRFKLVNDTYGHDAGDNFLKVVAQRLRSHVREGDLVARMGGDEFTVIIENTSRERAIAGVCEKLIDSLKPAIKVGEIEIYAKCSIGVSRFPFDAGDEVGLLRCADLAMYQSKQRGRNQFTFYEAAMDSANSKRAELERSMHQSLLTGGFYPVFQPIVSATSGQLVAIEALMRWSRLDGTVIGPDIFIPLAEESGLIHQLGEMMLREAAKLTKRWDEQSIESLKVNVNVSSVQLEKNFSEVLASIIAEELINPSRLVVEITESAIMNNLDACVAELRRIRALGVSVALDDFGTGYSSLAYLRHLPINTLKMDRSFVSEVHFCARDKSIFRAVLTMANELGIDVVAEGVEHLQHLSVLSELGCRLMQGYFFSPPLPLGSAPTADESAPWVRQMSAAMAIDAYRLG